MGMEGYQALGADQEGEDLGAERNPAERWEELGVTAEVIDKMRTAYEAEKDGANDQDRLIDLGTVIARFDKGENPPSGREIGAIEEFK